jgi:hypothetical protein
MFCWRVWKAYLCTSAQAELRDARQCLSDEAIELG